jgi:hypothetical protein
VRWLQQPNPRQRVRQGGASFRDLVKVVLEHASLVRIARRQSQPRHVRQHVARSRIQTALAGHRLDSNADEVKIGNRTVLDPLGVIADEHARRAQQDQLSTDLRRTDPLVVGDHGGQQGTCPVGKAGSASWAGTLADRLGDSRPHAVEQQRQL